MILWKRLVQDNINSEQIVELMQEGYDYLEKNQSAVACDKWINVWESLKKNITSDMTNVEDAEDILPGLKSIQDWCQDFETELWNAGLEYEKYHFTRIRYCQDFCDYFPNSSELIIVNMQRAIADSCFEIGDIEKGEKTYRNLIEHHPAKIWGYIGWGDIYAFGTASNTIKADPEKAKKIYGLALNKGMVDESFVCERLEKLNHL